MEPRRRPGDGNIVMSIEQAVRFLDDREAILGAFRDKLVPAAEAARGGDHLVVLEGDEVHNVAVLEAVVRSAKTGSREKIS